MKTLLKILAGIVAVIVVAVVAVLFLTADLVGVADEFFLAIKDKDIETAYSHLSDDFRADTSQEELVAFMESNRLADFDESSWQSRSVSGGRGELEGSITTTSGGIVPVALDFVKGQDGWKIYAIRKPDAGIQAEAAEVQIPSEEDQVRLVRDSMHVFAVSVNERSMAKFHAHTSNLWQQQFSIEDFDEAFGAFYDLGADLTVLDKFSPRFDAPASLGEDGVLRIAGHYPTEPDKMHFEQKYVFEGLGWKLVGFSANIK